ncbi:amidohydrolase [Wocania ichthyoenteri]|uniref:amidohydrolase n=1 Tax=Wocania ichthyoenteri TaxID=1230531 RepID=UPI0009DCF31E|nr:amidohydrolase [Wocania ichthyoenteri]
MVRKLLLFLILFTFTFALFEACQNKPPEADKIIINAKIWTGNDKQITAQAMAIKGDSILAIGNNEDIYKYKHSNSKIIDFKNAFVTPGFIDSHVHLMQSGHSLSSVQLRLANSKRAFTNTIESYIQDKDPGTWILEGNWDHTLWGGELPHKEWIDSFSKNNPVFICRLDGHMGLANSLALELAGIDKNTLDIEGGTIVRNEDGTPTGILKDNAMFLVLDKIPSYSKNQNRKALAEATEYLFSNGVTSVHDMGTISDYQTYQTAQREGALDLRIYSVMPLDKWHEVKELVHKHGKGDKWLQIGGLKGFVDGSLGSHTAAFENPYIDTPDDSGFFVNDESYLYKCISNADKSGLQVMIHAIGDKAINSLLNLYETISKENNLQDKRFRIEHAQHISEKDIARFSKLNIIPSMQPYHAIDDGRWAEKLIGPKRIKTTYAFKSLIDSGALIAFGSDWSVAPANPIEGIYAAVTRRTLDDKNPNGWVPEQKITVEQSLLAYTKNAAYAAFNEYKTGTLEPGKLADFVVLSDNLMAIDPKKLNKVKVLKTYVGGKKVFDISEK